MPNIPLGEAHLRRTLCEFVEHYERERNHQGVDNRLLIAAPMNNQGPVQRRDRLCGRSTSTTDTPRDCSLGVGRLLAHYGVLDD
jgi:hypothetical protein